jgi:hypothetical protein
VGGAEQSGLCVQVEHDTMRTTSRILVARNAERESIGYLSLAGAPTSLLYSWNSVGDQIISRTS